MNTKNKNEYVPFPVEVLPTTVADFVNEVVEALSCPAEFVVLPLISCLGAAVGNTATMNPKGTWSAPSIFWTATVGRSGCGKSPAFKEATKFIVAIENQAYKEFEKLQAEYEVNRNDKKAEIKLDPPKHVRRYTDDTTIEAHLSVLSQNPEGVALIVDELSGWFASFDKYNRGGAGSDSSKWIQLFDTRSVFIDRKTGDKKLIRVEKPIVNIAGTIQPKVLQNVVGGNIENGLLARFLLACPPTETQSWTSAEPDPRKKLSLIFLIRKLYELNAASLEKGTKELTFATDANEVWIKFYNSNHEFHENCEGPLEYAVSKLDQYCLRFACLYHVIENSSEDVIPSVVSKEVIEAAVKTTEWFRNEVSRVYELFDQSSNADAQMKLVFKIVKRGGEITSRDLHRSNTKKYPKTADATQDLDALVEAGLCYKDGNKYKLGKAPTLVEDWSEESLKF